MVTTVATSPYHCVGLPPSPNTLKTYGATGPRFSPVPPRVPRPRLAVFAAQTLELAKVLEETVVTGSTGAVVTLLTARLRTANCGSFLLTEDTLQTGATSQFSPDISREETFQSLLLVSRLPQPRAEEETEEVGRDLLYLVQLVTRQYGLS